jgi:hypothetical protein
MHTLLLLLCMPLAAQTSTPDAFEAARSSASAELREWYMSESTTAPAIAFSTDDVQAYALPIANLATLADEIALLKKGRLVDKVDWQTYSDMTVILAHKLGVRPPEDAIPVYRGLVRAEPLSEAEQAVQDRLTASANAPGLPKRYLYIDDLVGAPHPKIPEIKEKIVYRNVKGKKVKKVIAPPEMLPLPKPDSVLAQIDWERADELAEVADDNARGWERKPKESLKRYRRRLRQLRNRCYEWVRRDMTALGIWDANLFRGFVPPTKRDRKRPIRAASFAVAMAKIESDEKLASKTSLRQLNLRVDPLVRGAIVVFQKSVCGYSARNGHIEVITSLDPLQAASFKFHPVKTECLVKAANENKVHVFVPLRSS